MRRAWNLPRGALYVHAVVSLLAAFGCAAPGRDVWLQEGDFALLELELRDCTSNDQHLGLEKALRRLYGTSPQIDLDRQLARCKIPAPVLLDFPQLADEVRRANTGLGGILLTVEAIGQQDEVEFVRSGQRLPLEPGATPLPRQAGWRRITIINWDRTATVRARSAG